MMKAVHLTRVKSDEQVLEVSRLAHEIWREYYPPIIGADQTEYMLETIQSPEPVRRQMADGYEYYIVRSAGRSIGYIAIRQNDPAGDLFLSKIYFFEDERGHGYSRLVLDELDDMARRGREKRVWLTVNRGNPSTAVYEKLGFRTTEEKVTDIGGGYVMDDYIMYRDVPEE